MNITFVHLGREHLGIEYLSAFLKNAGHKTSLALDPGLFGINDNVFYMPALERVFSQKDRVVKKVEDSNPDIVAFSVYTSTYLWAKELARIIKGKLNVPIVFGGIHTSLVPENVIKNDFIDFIIIGEGEKAFLALAESLSGKRKLEDVPNLWYKNDKNVYKNPIGSPVDLDTLPFPDKALFEREIRIKDDYLVMTGRGCPNSCSYCCESFYNSMYKGTFFRRRGVDSVITELKEMKKRYNFKRVTFNDPIFFTDKKWLGKILADFKKEIGVLFRCFGQVTFLDKEVAYRLKEYGVYVVEFGVQTLNERLRKETLFRRESNMKNKEAFSLCDDLKIRYDVDHMFGIPGEKLDDHIYAAQFYKKLRYLNRIKCHQLTYFPGLKIMDIALEQGVLDKNDVEIINRGEDKGDFFHEDSIKDPVQKDENSNFKVLLKLLPLIPEHVLTFVLRRGFYKIFRFIPGIFIVFCQIIIAIIKRDYRFWIYFKHYIFQLTRRFF